MSTEPTQQMQDTTEYFAELKEGPRPDRLRAVRCRDPPGGRSQAGVGV